jgi:hypothetical protein
MVIEILFAWFLQFMITGNCTNTMTSQGCPDDLAIIETFIMFACIVSTVRTFRYPHHFWISLLLALALLLRNDNDVEIYTIILRAIITRAIAEAFLALSLYFYILKDVPLPLRLAGTSASLFLWLFVTIILRIHPVALYNYELVLVCIDVVLVDIYTSFRLLEKYDAHMESKRAHVDITLEMLKKELPQKNHMRPWSIIVAFGY